MIRINKKIDRLDFISRAYPRYTNATGNITMRPQRIFYPKNIEDIQLILKDAHEKGIQVRPVGAGHSFSEVTKEEYYLIQPFDLEQCEKYEYALTPGAMKSGRHLIKAQSGLRIKCLNKKLRKMNLALDNMGAFDWQTISGALSTGTHGTGLNRPAFPDMVRSLIIILADGQIMQIEPSEGITDPSKFNPDSGIILKQDDEYFYSVVLSFGAMGFIYEIILEVGNRYWIEETRKIMDWDTVLKPNIQNGTFQKWIEQEYDFVSFRINPYYVKDRKTGMSTRLCSVALQKAFDRKPSWHKAWKAYSRNIIFTILGNMRIVSWLLIQWLNGKLSRIPNSIHSALKGTSDEHYVNDSYKVLYQSGLSLRKEGISSEFAFPLDYSKLIDILDQLAVHFEQLKEKHQLYQSSHIPVRFVPVSKAFLSQCFQGPTVYIDLPALDRVNGVTQIMQKNQEFMIHTLNGLPHWGKINSELYSHHHLVSRFYPRAATWSKIRKALDPVGMFYSQFVKKMGL